MFRIANNAVVDHFRRERKFVFTDDESQLEKAVIQPFINDGDRLADCCLNSFIQLLPAKYREVLILIEMEGKSQKETAQELGLSYSGLKSRVQRARKMLKKSILDCCDYEFDKYGNVVDCCSRTKN